MSQGGSYTLTDDTGKAVANGETGYVGTRAAILSGTNGSTGKDYNNRALTKTVDTGWTPKDDDDLASDILTLWGMAYSLATNFTDLSNSNYNYEYVVPNTTRTDTYVLSMTYDTLRGHLRDLARGEFGLAVRNGHGKWVNAVDANFGGPKRFVLGPWKSAYKLGAYGVDPFTRTAWAVINHPGDFAVAEDLEPGSHHHQPWHDEEDE